MTEPLTGNKSIWAVVNDQDHIDHWTTYAIAVNNAINVALNGDTQAAVNQALEDLIDSIGIPKENLCTHCFDGSSYCHEHDDEIFK